MLLWITPDCFSQDRINHLIGSVTVGSELDSAATAANPEALAPAVLRCHLWWKGFYYLHSYRIVARLLLV